jgi:hypothetical protein
MPLFKTLMSLHHMIIPGAVRPVRDLIAEEVA